MIADCFTHADQQQWNSCRRTFCGCVVRRKSCQLLIWEGDSHCQRQGWYRQLSMPALDLTTTDAPGLQLCTPVVAGQEASTTRLAGARCGHIIWRWWWHVRLCTDPYILHVCGHMRTLAYAPRIGMSACVRDVVHSVMLFHADIWVANACGTARSVNGV